MSAARFSEITYRLAQAATAPDHRCRVASDACYPVTWPSNYEWRCQRGHVHRDGKTAIGGDFAL